MYKAMLQAHGLCRTDQYVGRTALLLISVGKPYHEAEKLAAVIDRINFGRFGRCIVAVADTLQRHNYRAASAQANHRESRRHGDEWIKRNEELIAKLLMSTEIVRWDDLLRRTDYAPNYHMITNEYYSNPDYREAIDETIEAFAARNGITRGMAGFDEIFYRALFYILEECPIIMPMWAQDGIEFIIYPKQMTRAMRKTRDLFVSNRHPNCANWLSVKFKKRQASSAEAIGAEQADVDLD